MLVLACLEGGAVQVPSSGYKKPEVPGGAGLRHHLWEAPRGLLENVLLFEVAGTKILRLRGVAIQLEVGGHVGEVPEAVSWEWLPGAPCSHVLRGPTHENSCGHTPPQTPVCSVRCVVRPGNKRLDESG